MPISADAGDRRTESPPPHPGDNVSKTPKRRGGRPKQSVKPDTGPGLSIENPLDSLPPSARSILAAARAVLAERGFEGLTIEAVANEANVSRTLIPYHFGSRAGLVEILIDSLFHDFAVGIWRGRATDTSPGGMADFLEMVRLEAHDVIGQRDFFELMVCALREETLRNRVAELFAHYRRFNVKLAGIGSDRSGAPASGAPSGAGEAVGAVLQALADGLALQAAMDPGFDLDAAIAAAGRMLRPGPGELLD
jgi:AcrR family transcriptional regulator